ncbi:hypothetical protein R1flu_011863 [Riccia fluitans]|uniref:Reverse transcriptase zinc-binding domain-containing protein n=1 Tax=Riccia fluitans TaxID=41844 RepID=A0ABD1Z8Z5_9MARC
MKRVRAAWQDEAVEVWDSRRRWTQGWQRVKQILKEVRKEKSEQRKKDEGLPQEIEWRRERISAESSPEEVAALAKAEERLKARELQNAREWKIRSCDKWIAEDATPAQYFFAKLRVKWAREAFHALENSDGEVVMEDEGILESIYLFYQDLFSAEPDSVEKVHARGDVVGLLDRELSEIDRNHMSAIPDRDEIERVMFWMARYKAPGQDGLTVDVVKECWEFVGEECVMMKANFDELLKILEEYELASGAKVNIVKSLVMPLGSKEVPIWVGELGCEIGGSGRLLRYLGVQMGVDLLGNESTTAALRKLNSQILQWENFYLPLAARMARPKEQGGLGLMGFKDRSDALQMQYMIAILDGRNVEWIWMAKRMLQIKLLTRPCKRERKLWRSEMVLLLLPSWKIEEAPTLDRLLKVWFRFWKFLRFFSMSTVVPANLPIVSFKKWWVLIGEECPDIFAAVEECTKKLGAVKMGDVSQAEWGREVGAVMAGEARVGNVEAGAEVLRWLLEAQISDRPLRQIVGWVWQPGVLVGEQWELPNRIWLRMLYSRGPSVEGLNRHWRVEQNGEIWRSRWWLLWAGVALMKHRTWIWRLLQLGLPTCERAEKWKKSDGKYPWCSFEKESIAHLVWECRRNRNRVSWLSEICVGGSFSTPTFLQVLDSCLKSQALAPAGLTLLSEHCLACWKEQNGLVFEKKREVASPRLVLLRAKISVKAGWSQLRRDKWERVRWNDEIFLAKAMTALWEQEDRGRIVRRILLSCEEMSGLNELDLSASVGSQFYESRRVLATSGSSSSCLDASEDSVSG